MISGAILADLGYMFHDWIAYYNDNRKPPDDTLVDHLCVCKLEGGPVLVRKLANAQLKRRGPMDPAPQQ